MAIQFSSDGHLSASRISCYLSCPESYRLRYIEKKRFVRVTPATGKAIHKGAEGDNRKKVASGSGLPKNDVVDLAVAAYDEEIKSGEVLEGKNEVEDGRDTAASGAGAWVEIVSPTVLTPEYVETPIEASFTSDLGQITIACVLDLAERRQGHFVRDLKTGKRRKNPDFAHGSGQLSVQGISVLAVTGAYPVGFQVDSLFYTKRGGWQYEALPTDRTEEDYQSWWDRAYAVDAAIKAGSFPPAPEGSWKCSPAFCEYWHICRYVASRRRHYKGDTDE